MLRDSRSRHETRSRYHRSFDRLGPEDRDSDRGADPHRTGRRRRIGPVGRQRPDRALGRQLPGADDDRPAGFQALALQRGVQYGQIHGHRPGDAGGHLRLLCRIARTRLGRGSEGQLPDSRRAGRHVQRRLRHHGRGPGRRHGPATGRQQRDGEPRVRSQGPRANDPHSVERPRRRDFEDHADLPRTRRGHPDGGRRRSRRRTAADRRQQHPDTQLRRPEEARRYGLCRHRAGGTHVGAGGDHHGHGHHPRIAAEDVPREAFRRGAHHPDLLQHSARRPHHPARQPARHRQEHPR